MPFSIGTPGALGGRLVRCGVNAKPILVLEALGGVAAFIHGVCICPMSIPRGARFIGAAFHNLSGLVMNRCYAISCRPK